MTDHCKTCGSRLCNHGNCPECRPCPHADGRLGACDGGDRADKYFGDEDPQAYEPFE